MSRIPEKTSLDIDVTKPLPERSDIEIESDCFGKEWDLAASECRQCAVKEICGTIFKAQLKVEASNIEAKTGTKYLDKQDFKLVNWKSIIEEHDGKTAQELIRAVAEKARTSDRVAVVNQLKVRENEGLFTVKDDLTIESHV